jgi:hypothetical protein
VTDRRFPGVELTIAIFIVLLTLVAGLVAAAGDRMGQLAAKRKIRIGKLRPRDASRLVAVFTGMAISLVTFGVVFAVWSDFREALTRYRETKQSLASVLAERDGMLDEIREAQSGRDEALNAMQGAVDSQKQAEELTLNAQNMLQAVEDQLSVADAQIAAKEKELSIKQAEVGRIQKELSAAREELKNIAIQKEGDRLQLKSLGELKEQARRDIEELNQELADLKGSPVVIPLGKTLAYKHIPPNADDIFGRLNEAIKKVQLNMVKEGFEIDERSVDAAQAFADKFKLGSDGAVVILRSGRNVFTGDRVLLDFSSIQLVPIVRKGSDFMTISVNENNSTVTVLGSPNISLTIGGKVDLNFISRLDRLYRETATNAGFLPKIEGSVESSILNELMFQADEINAHVRPFVIHLRAPRDMTAIDGIEGLAELEIVVTEGSR